ncbi:hypothetical protein D5S18_34170 [Nocardia panacis]|uniref:Uncharacterized protein n=1 Tax=Nocardia panacis TaxID=2340916 RepID=A0A3A4JHY8_9NOCA|nr:hypothetical protein [Nocardia panacis]RJO67949.1 hypothetical protein D5S18_34170 [Nocardia panacis]
MNLDNESAESGIDKMRLDFVRFYHLSVAAEFARSDGERTALLKEADRISTPWREVPGERTIDWWYLSAAVGEWARDSAGMQGHLDAVDEGRIYITNDQRASLVQAKQLNAAREAAIRPAEFTDELAMLPYRARIKPAEDTEAIEKHTTSWWLAREWLSDISCVYPEQVVDVEIAWYDQHSGEWRNLIEGSGVGTEDLRVELADLDRLLGGRRTLDPKPWLNDLVNDVLSDEYRAALVEQNNPWASTEHRIEHRLHADDLRDQILEFAGVEHAADHLADIDTSVKEMNHFALEPQTGTWVDQMSRTAEYAFRQSEREVVRVNYHPDPTQPDYAIHAGYSNVDSENPWYAEEQISWKAEGKRLIEIRLLGRFNDLPALVQELQTYRIDGVGAGSQSIPASILDRLSNFDRYLIECADMAGNSKRLADGIRARAPYVVAARGDSVRGTRVDGLGDGGANQNVESGGRTIAQGQPSAIARGGESDRRQRLRRNRPSSRQRPGGRHL